jgi:MoxR-like ATPase
MKEFMEAQVKHPTAGAITQASLITPSDDAVIAKCQTMIDQLRQYFMEREEIIECQFIALLCRQHILLIGPPGTAKSGVIEGFCGCVEGFRMFQWQLTKYSVPEELFGPYKVSALMNDKFERKVTDKLPEAEIAYLDEVFNANGSILNALNSAMNERTFEGEPIPLESLYGATNFTPEDTNLVAHFDRYLFRFIVEPIQDKKNFVRMLMNSLPFSVLAQDRLTKGQIAQLQAKVPYVIVPDTIAMTISKIRQLLKEEQIEPSDRRFKWALAALRARALLQNRDRVCEDDLFLLTNILWTDKKEMGVVSSTIIKAINPAFARIQELAKIAKDVNDQMKKIAKPEDELPKLKDALKKLSATKKEIDDVRQKSFFGDREKHTLDAVVKQIDGFKSDIRRRAGFDDD